MPGDGWVCFQIVTRLNWEKRKVKREEDAVPWALLEAFELEPEQGKENTDC